MSLPLTPERIASVYTMLRAWPPFSGWRLPHESDVKFRIAHTEQWHAQHSLEGDRHVVDVSDKGVTQFVTLQALMGHEMIHMKQYRDKTETPNTIHNAAFRRIWKSVCRRYGWDYALFV